MPTYELRCRECGYTFDRFVMRMLRDEDKVCPECESRDVAPGVGGGVVVRPEESPAACVPRGGFA